MGSKDKSGLEKEKALLEALQNREKKLLSGMYGDFFGKNGSGNETGLSFGDRIDELEQKGRNVTSQFSSQADDLVNRQKAVSSQLKNRTDALQRANDALREVHSLLDNPLYNGMPSVTGRNTAGSSDTNNMNPIEDAGGEIDPGMMAGTDGDLFNGIAPGAFGVPGASGAPGAVQMDAPQVQEQQAAGKTAPAEKAKEEEKDPMEELDALIGLKTIKHDVRELTDFVRVQKLRKDGGLKSVPVSLHLVFTGNPGTGKTTVARIISRIYKQIGVLSGGQLVEVVLLPAMSDRLRSRLPRKSRKPGAASFLSMRRMRYHVRMTHSGRRRSIPSSRLWRTTERTLLSLSPDIRNPWRSLSTAIRASSPVLTSILNSRTTPLMSSWAFST